MMLKSQIREQKREQEEMFDICQKKIILCASGEQEKEMTKNVLVSLSSKCNKNLIEKLSSFLRPGTK